jgi:hypothetical protein
MCPFFACLIYGFDFRGRLHLGNCRRLEVEDSINVVFCRCVRWHETLFSVGVHARSCLALGSRPSESCGILREMFIWETLIDASCIDNNA